MGWVSLVISSQGDMLLFSVVAALFLHLLNDVSVSQSVSGVSPRCVVSVALSVCPCLLAQTSITSLSRFACFLSNPLSISRPYKNTRYFYHLFQPFAAPRRLNQPLGQSLSSSCTFQESKSTGPATSAAVVRSLAGPI